MPFIGLVLPFFEAPTITIVKLNGNITCCGFLLFRFGSLIKDTMIINKKESITQKSVLNGRSMIFSCVVVICRTKYLRDSKNMG